MNHNPLISVLMPCYNAMPYLPEALNSILNQTYGNLEIICINDGSFDETGKVLEEFAKKDKRIKVIHNDTNLKLIRSLNKAIALAQGDYIARMDADDISDLNRFEVELKYLQLNPEIDIVATGYINISETGKLISKNIPRQFSSIACLFASFFYVPIGHAELLFKSSVLKDNSYLLADYSLHTEDYELWTRLLRKGYQLNNIENLLYFVRINSQSVSRKFTKIQDDNFIECARRHYIEYSNISYSNEVIRVIVNRINNEISLNDFKYALKAIKKFKTYFIKKEGLNERAQLNEINIIFYTHLFDIYYQGIKKAAFIIKIYIFWLVLFNIHKFLNKDVLKYLRNKL